MKIEYSLDMIRLSSRVLLKEFENYINYYISLNYDTHSLFEQWDSFKIREYRYNFKVNVLDQVTGEVNSYWIGYKHNTEKNDDYGRYSLVVEYNPNKINIDKNSMLYELLHQFFIFSEFKLVSVDLAMDLHGLDISNIQYDKNRKRDVRIFGYGDNKTVYIGKGNGRTKIYNKALERGLEGEKWTRYEVTLQYNFNIKQSVLKCISEFGLSLDLDFELVDIYSLIGTQVSMSDLTLDGTDKALIFAVQHGFPLEELSRRKRDKIKKILSESTTIEIDRKSFFNAINKHFAYIYDLYF